MDLPVGAQGGLQELKHPVALASQRGWWEQEGIHPFSYKPPTSWRSCPLALHSPGGFGRQMVWPGALTIPSRDPLGLNRPLEVSVGKQMPLCIFFTL